MAKTTKSKQRPKAHTHVQLTDDVIVERDMKRSVKRLKNISRLQQQIRRELVRSRQNLAEFVNWLGAHQIVDVEGARASSELK